MNRTRHRLVPFALAAMGALAVALPGCRKEEEEKPAPSSPAVYMNDPVFRKQLTDGRKEREGYIVKRTKLVREMEKMIEAKKAELPGADDAALKAALEKDPAWADLTKRLNDLTAAIRENGRAMDEELRKRVAPKKDISK